MTPAQFITIQDSLGLDNAEMSLALRLEPTRTVRRYRAGTVEIPGPVSLLMEIYNLFENGQEFNEHAILITKMLDNRIEKDGNK